MEYIKKNKGVIIFLLILIIFTISVVIINKNREIKQQGNSVNDIKYEANTIVPMYVNEEEMARKYYSDYMYLISSNSKFAYELLDDDYKLEKYPTYNEFYNYIKGKKYGSLKEYAASRVNNKKAFYVIDSLGNELIFIEDGVMNYKVKLR